MLHETLLACLAVVSTAEAPCVQECVDPPYSTTRRGLIEISNQQTCSQSFTVHTTGMLTGVDVDIRHWRGVSTSALQVPVTSPSATNACGPQVFLQSIVLDTAASRRIGFSQGLRLLYGA